jgi:hypothetical protein
MENVSVSNLQKRKSVFGGRHPPGGIPWANFFGLAF